MKKANLEIIYRDEYLVAINKPHGLLVHRSEYSGIADEYAVQKLRDMLGMYVYPCHRIDRKTGGVLLFALNEEANRFMQQQFAANQIKKKYIAIVRGYTEDSGIIDYPLTNFKGKTQEAITNFRTIKKTELDIPFGKFETSRYSLVEIMPQTGRMHQIRKHFAHIMHPIIGDRPHGCNKQNRLFKERWNMNTMMLHALELEFIHPITKKEIVITAELQSEFNRVLEIMGWS
ncbi:MAG: tRNA pseudouridine(65) synthase TruC [Bacteroidales bacterium]|nr:tRNA pseudouridine(65) synthase TruC [Bacteroidales bacterium]